MVEEVMVDLKATTWGENMKIQISFFFSLK